VRLLSRVAALGAAVVVGTLLAPLPAAADNVRDAEYWLADYGILDAWTITRGAGVTIAVIDTGVDGSVPELQGAVVGGADFSGIGSADGQAPVGSTNSNHGTMVASLAAGRGTGAGSGVIGSAPEAGILALSIGFGEGTTSSDDQIAAAVRFAVDQGAGVINMSLTRNTLDWPESWDDAFLYAMEHDVVVVAAAGNRGSGTTEVGAPATMPGVLTVAGTDENGQASFDSSSQGITIGVAAPSESLVGVAPGGDHVIWGGTSGATPIVSGIVALVRAAHPELDAANVIQRVIATARDAGDAGADPIYGFGLVDAWAAVSSDVPSVDANPMGDLGDWIRLHRRADSTPVPGPTGVPTATPPPAIAGPSDPTGTLLPSANQLRDTGLPLLVLTLFAGVLVAVCTLAVRRFRRLRQPR
jgi:type VII secretion-associated serine protease mycosin